MGEVPFKCLHSGKCCSLIYIQINLTVGDLLRLSDFLKKSVLEMFNEGVIGFMPFFDTQNAYDIEIGLIKPCKLHINNRCFVYPARPLNCRIFPYFLLANFNKPELSEIFNSSYQCIHRIKMNDELKKKYRNYSKKLGEIIMKESEMTERLFNNVGFHLSFPVSDFKTGNSGEKPPEEIEEMKIKFFIKKIPDLKEYKEKISKEAENFRKEIYTLKEINKIVP